MYYRNNVTRSRNLYTFSATLRVWYYLSRKGRFYGELSTPAAMKLTSSRKVWDIFAPFLTKRGFLKSFLPQ